MKKIITIVGTVCVLLIVAFSIGAEIAALRKEVLSLQERVKALEKRLDSAAIFVLGSQPWKGSFRLLDALRQYTPVPKGWQKRQHPPMQTEERSVLEYQKWSFKA